MEIDAIREQLAAAIAARLQKMREPAERVVVPQAEIAEELALTQPKVSQLLRADVTGFSIDRLIDIAGRVGLVVRVSVTRPYNRDGDEE
jgi:predicted XRE-type DNA-binding protein